MNSSLRRELLAMADEDQTVRARLAADGSLFAGYHPEMEAVHRRNSLRLRDILDCHGWPGKSLVGEDGAQAAFLVVQHAIGDPPLMRRCLHLLKEAIRCGEMDPIPAAYLEDRICYFEGRPQRYGTQVDWNEQGVLSPHIIEDPDQVDARRQVIGLPPLNISLGEIRKTTAQEVEMSPMNHAERCRRAREWARSVGWLDG